MLRVIIIFFGDRFSCNLRLFSAVLSKVWGFHTRWSHKVSVNVTSYYFFIDYEFWNIFCNLFYHYTQIYLIRWNGILLQSYVTWRGFQSLRKTFEFQMNGVIISLEEWFVVRRLVFVVHRHEAELKYVIFV